MELPFAVDASTMVPKPDGSSSTASSLVTASSQGSLVPAEQPLHPHSVGTDHHHAMGEYRAPTAPMHHQEPPDTASHHSSITSTTGVALKAAGNRVSSVLSNFGFNRSSTSRGSVVGETFHHPPAAQNQQQQQQQYDNTEVIDFAYINVTDEDEVDIWLDDRNNTAQYALSHYSENSKDDSAAATGRTDILAVLLQQDENGRLVDLTEHANEAAASADAAKKEGNLQEALDRHTESAKFFHEAAELVKEHDGECKEMALRSFFFV